MKMLLTISLAVLLIFAAAQAEDYTWSDNGDGTCTITDYTGPGGDVIVPDTLGGLTVTAIGDLAFYECDWVSSVTIHDSVISIGYEAFLQAEGLLGIIVVPANPAFSSVDGVLFNKDQTELFRYPAAKTEAFYDIPDSVMAIGKTAFEACSGLTSATIPAGVISIGDRVFHNCENLSNITVDEANPAYMSEAGVLFDKNQTEIIKYSPAMLGDSYTVPNTVTSITDFAFVQSTNLTSVIIPDSVTAIGTALFAMCTNLPEITVDPANPAYMSKAGVLFNKSQTELVEYPPGKAGGYTIPDSVIAVRYGAFATSINLTSVITPDSVTSIGDYAFAWCQNLTGVYFRGDTPTLGGVDVFEDSDNATVYYIPETVGWGPTFGGRPTAEWPPSPADADLNYEVDFYDFSVLAGQWDQTDCNASNDWCQWADFDQSGAVDPGDLALLADDWLYGIAPCR